VSDFLVNLARRSAGQSPVARAEWTPPAAADADAAAAVERDGAPIQHVALPAPPAATTSAPERAMPIDRYVPPPQPIAHVAAVAAGEIVQRVALVPAVAAPQAPLAPPPARPSAEVTPHVAVAPAHVEAPAQDPSPQVVAIPARASDWSAVSRVVAPPPPVSDAPGRDVPTVLPLVERITERIVTEEHGIEPQPDDRILPPLPRHVDAEVRTPQPAAAGSVAMARDADPPAERVVHVRIGAVEIHGPVPPPPPIAAPAIAPTLATTEPFERFARLRSYASWDR